MAEIIKSVRLECITPEHNKFYELVITMIEGVYVLNASYGKIGNNPQSQIKYSGKYLSSAESEYSILVKEKKKKGYKEITKAVKNNPILLPTELKVNYGTVKVKMETENLTVKKIEDPPEKRDRFDNLE